VLHLQEFARCAFDDGGDRVPVCRAGRERLQNQQVQGALEHLAGLHCSLRRSKGEKG
jgi:hypothetical protein